MKKTFKWIVIVFLGIILVSSASFVIWAETVLGPEQVAIDALTSDKTVTITKKSSYIIFAPANGQPTTALVFYPGGRVDFRSYAPPLRLIAQRGYLVVLMPVRLNLAFFDINAAEPVIKVFPAIQHWVVGGHSLGGVAADIFAESHSQVEGIVFWASYPADGKLKNSSIRMVSIFGTRDGLATSSKIDASKSLMPADTVFVSIEGGNHAQFGAYGLQPGDNRADIPAETQWQQIADATVSFLRLLAK